jgi:hypothetical protein
MILKEELKQKYFLKKKTKLRILGNKRKFKYQKSIDLGNIKENFLKDYIYDNFKFEKEKLFEQNFIKENNPYNIIIPIINNKDKSEYEIKKIIFFKEEFTFNHFNMINRLISDSNNLTIKIKKDNSLHVIIFKIIKELLFTELEIVYLALFLEKFGWENDKLSEINSQNFQDNNNIKSYDLTFEENFFFSSLFVKVKFYILNFISYKLKFLY